MITLVRDLKKEMLFLVSEKSSKSSQLLESVSKGAPCPAIAGAEWLEPLAVAELSGSFWE